MHSSKNKNKLASSYKTICPNWMNWLYYDKHYYEIITKCNSMCTNAKWYTLEQKKKKAQHEIKLKETQACSASRNQEKNQQQ